MGPLSAQEMLGEVHLRYALYFPEKSEITPAILGADRARRHFRKRRMEFTEESRVINHFAKDARPPTHAAFHQLPSKLGGLLENATWTP